MSLRSGMLHTCAALLRDPGTLGGGAPRAALERHGPTLLAITLVAAAVFGAVIGTYRGGAQLVYSALKLPLLWLVPVLVALPAVRALYRVCGIAVAYGQVALAVLVGVARGTLVLAVASPVLWLAYSVAVDYHLAVLALCVALVLAGTLGLVTTTRILPGRGGTKVLANLLAMGALGVVFAQTGWVLRPFVARPRADVAFLRPVESNVFASVFASWSSARGRYDGWDPRREGLLAVPEPEDDREVSP